MSESSVRVILVPRGAQLAPDVSTDSPVTTPERAAAGAANDLSDLFPYPAPAPTP